MSACMVARSHREVFSLDLCQPCLTPSVYPPTGRSSSEISSTLQKIVEAYGCNLVEGVLSHQLKQFIIDGNKCVLNKPNPETKVEDQTFEENEVYGIDIVVSTGEGKSRVTDERETTVRTFRLSRHCMYILTGGLDTARTCCSLLRLLQPTLC